jgi:dTMP kinase
VLPPVRDTSGPDADETAVLPKADDGPTDRVPSDFFRPAEPENERTRELPAAQPSTRRPRPSWAEETPLDDLPSLADELLGPHDDDHPDSRRR